MRWAIGALGAGAIGLLKGLLLIGLSLLYPSAAVFPILRVIFWSVLTDVVVGVVACLFAGRWIDGQIQTGIYSPLTKSLDEFLSSRTALRAAPVAVLGVGGLAATGLLGFVAGGWHPLVAAAVLSLVLPAALWTMALLGVGSASLPPPPMRADTPPPREEPPPPQEDWLSAIRKDHRYTGQALFVGAIGGDQASQAETRGSSLDRSVERHLASFGIERLRGHQARVLAALTASFPRRPATILYMGPTGAGKSTAMAVAALWGASLRATTTLVIVNTAAAASRLELLLRRTYSVSPLAPSIRLGLLTQTGEAAGSKKDVLVGTWEDVHAAFLRELAPTLSDFFADLGLVWIEEGGELSGATAAHAAGALRRLDLACAGREPDIVVVSSDTVADPEFFIRALTGRPDAAHVHGAAARPTTTLITWRPSMRVERVPGGTNDSPRRNFSLRLVRLELREVCALLAEAYPLRERRRVRLLVYHPSLALAEPDRQAIRDAATKRDLEFAADLTEVEAAALGGRFDAAIVAGPLFMDGQVLDDVHGFLAESALLLLMVSPGALTSAWYHLPQQMASLMHPVRTVPAGQEAVLINHLAAAVLTARSAGGVSGRMVIRAFGSEEGVARACATLREVGWIAPPDDEDDQLYRLRPGPNAEAAIGFLRRLPLDQVPPAAGPARVLSIERGGVEGFGFSLIPERRLELVAKDMFLMHEERAADWATDRRFETQRYNVVESNDSRVRVEGPVDYALLDEAAHRFIWSRIVPHLHVTTVATLIRPAPGGMRRFDPIEVSVALKGLLRYDGREDPAHRDAKAAEAEATVQRILAGWSFSFAAADEKLGISEIALWDLADLLGGLLGLVVRRGGPGGPLAMIQGGTCGTVHLLDPEGPGIGFSALDPDDDKALGRRLLTLALVSLVSCPCAEGCSLCLGVFHTCRPRHLLGQHAKQAVSAVIETLLRPFGLPDFIEDLLEGVNVSGSEAARLKWIRDHVSRPLMEARLALVIRKLADLEVQVNPTVEDKPVGGFYSSVENKVVIKSGYQGGPAEAIVTHEYAHNWQHDDLTNFPLATTSTSLAQEDYLLLLEGFAEWVSYKILQARGHVSEMQHIDLNDGNEYGDGFDFYQQLEAEQGQQRVLKFARKPTEMVEEELRRRLQTARTS